LKKGQSIVWVNKMQFEFSIWVRPLSICADCGSSHLGPKKLLWQRKIALLKFSGQIQFHSGHFRFRVNLSMLFWESVFWYGFGLFGFKLFNLGHFCQVYINWIKTANIMRWISLNMTKLIQNLKFSDRINETHIWIDIRNK